MEEAIVEAMTFFLRAARKAVLDGRVPPPQGVLVAAGPDMRNWPGEGLWRSVVDRLVRPVVERIYRRSYRATAGHDPAPNDVQRQSDAAANRLVTGGWLRRVWAAAQQTLTASHTQQESEELQAQRIADVLTIDAAGRETREIMAHYRAIVNSADISDAARKAALAELDKAERRTAAQAGRPWRSEATATAVTETTNAASAGAYDAGQTSEQTTGQTARKRWVAYRDPATGKLDDRVRDAHREADGQEVPLDEPFTVGGESLRYPGDPSGSPGNVINCRCSVSVIPAATLAAAAKENTVMTTPTVTAAVSAAIDLPFAPRETPWDAEAARSAVRKWATDGDGKLDAARYARAFLLADEESSPSDYRLPIATVVDGELRAVWRGVQSAASTVNGARGGVQGLAPEQESALKERLGGLYQSAATAFADPEIRPPWHQSGSGEETTTASAGTTCTCSAPAVEREATPGEPLPEVPTAGTGCSCQQASAELQASAEQPAPGPRWRILVASAERAAAWPPPREWFDPPMYDAPHAIRVTPDGRIRGHLAAWAHDGMPNCHVGYSGECVTPPSSPSGYRYFHQTTLDMPDGSELDVGLITMDTGHAAVGLNAGGAVEHYDNTGTMAAVVRAGEDEHGIWVAGSVLPTLTDDQRLRLSLARYSGDWRTRNGNLELIAALAVNTPGFPNPSRADYALVAAGALAPAEQAGGESAAAPEGDSSSDGGGCDHCQKNEPTGEPAPAAEAQPETASEPAAASETATDEPQEAATDEPQPEAAADLDEWGDLAPLDEATGAAVMAIVEAEGQPGDKDVTAASTLVASGKGGGLPNYVKRTAKHIQERTGFDKSRSIASAWVAVKKICATGDSTLPGEQKVNAKSRAEACAAVATIGSLAVRASAAAAEASKEEPAGAGASETAGGAPVPAGQQTAEVA